MGDNNLLVNKTREEGLRYIFSERSGLVKQFKRDFGENLFEEFCQMMFIISGNVVWKLTREGEEYCNEYF